LGKSRSYVTFASALIDAPDWLMALYRAGRCRGMRELYELRRLSEIHPARVSAWLHGRDFVSRGDVLSLREGLGLSSVVDPSTTDSVVAAPAGVVKEAALRQPAVASAAQESAQEARGRAPLPLPETSPRKAPTRLVADFEGNPVRVWLDAAPESAGQVFVTPMREGGARTAVTIEALRALRLVHR
jgi:ParB family chromosome partitioning protein